MGKFFGKFLLFAGGAVLGFAAGVALLFTTVKELRRDEAVIFYHALAMLERNYVGELDYTKLYRGAAAGLLKATGDPYTVFLDEKDFAGLEEMRTGSFGGIGVVYGKRGDDYIIISVLEDNPSAKAGVKPGEKILAVNGKSTKTMHMDEVSMAIRGDVGTEVEITLGDKKGGERKVKIIRGLIKSPTVVGKALEETKNKIGYIRIGQFNDNTTGDFLTELKKLSDGGMEALILDLRYNPGGLLDQAVKISGELVPAGPVVSTIGKDGNRHTLYSKLNKVRWPLVVLVNEGSASASEIVAGAVKDTGAGILVGTKTFGKGSVQAVYPLYDSKTGIKVTIAKYYTPKGICINDIGIEPDVKVELPENSKTDVQLEKAKEILLKKIAKP